MHAAAAAFLAVLCMCVLLLLLLVAMRVRRPNNGGRCPQWREVLALADDGTSPSPLTAAALKALPFPDWGEDTTEYIFNISIQSFAPMGATALRRVVPWQLGIIPPLRQNSYPQGALPTQSTQLPQLTATSGDEEVELISGLAIAAGLLIKVFFETEARWASQAVEDMEPISTFQAAFGSARLDLDDLPLKSVRDSLQDLVDNSEATTSGDITGPTARGLQDEADVSADAAPDAADAVKAADKAAMDGDDSQLLADAEAMADGGEVILATKPSSGPPLLRSFHLQLLANGVPIVPVNGPDNEQDRPSWCCYSPWMTVKPQHLGKLNLDVNPAGAWFSVVAVPVGTPTTTQITNSVAIHTINSNTPYQIVPASQLAPNPDRVALYPDEAGALGWFSIDKGTLEAGVMFVEVQIGKQTLAEALVPTDQPPQELFTTIQRRQASGTAQDRFASHFCMLQPSASFFAAEPLSLVKNGASAGGPMQTAQWGSKTKQGVPLNALIKRWQPSLESQGQAPTTRTAWSAMMRTREYPITVPPDPITMYVEKAKLDPSTNTFGVTLPGEGLSAPSPFVLSVKVGGGSGVTVLTPETLTEWMRSWATIDVLNPDGDWGILIMTDDGLQTAPYATPRPETNKYMLTHWHASSTMLFLTVTVDPNLGLGMKVPSFMEFWGANYSGTGLESTTLASAKWMQGGMAVQLALSSD